VYLNDKTIVFVWIPFPLDKILDDLFFTAFEPVHLVAKDPFNDILVVWQNHGGCPRLNIT
jgi:hypothetical protein